MKKTGKMVLFKNGDEEHLEYLPSIQEIMHLQASGWNICGEVEVVGEMCDREYFNRARITRKEN